VEDSVAAELQKLPPNQRQEQLRAMLQALLADRFKLKVSHTAKDLPIYALVVAKMLAAAGMGPLWRDQMGPQRQRSMAADGDTSGR
jgi:uncharacterized protein (TIGR03435 family)